MTRSDPAMLARTFIADEEKTGRDGSKPSFWTMNHYRIVPIAGKLATVLTPSERVTFYVFYMQRSGGFPAVPNKEIPLLIDAYRRLLPNIDDAFSSHMASRLDCLHVFGFDETGELSDGTLASAKELKGRLKTLTQVSRYTTLPAQRNKKEKFRLFAEEAPRLLEILRHLNYIHDRRRYTQDRPRLGETFHVSNLKLWGMILIILLNSKTRTELIRDLVDGAADLPKRQSCLGLLYSTIRAIMDEVDAEETEFHELAKKLATIEMARRDATESVALVRALGLPQADEFQWDICVNIAEQGSDRDPYLAPHLKLRVRPDPEFQWEVLFIHSTKGSYSESPTKVSRNDPGVKPLQRLDAFPAWLKNIGETHGVLFDVDNTAVLAGRKRSAAKRIAEWVRCGI